MRRVTFLWNPHREQWEMHERDGRTIFTISGIDESEIAFWRNWAAQKRQRELQPA